MPPRPRPRPANRQAGDQAQRAVSPVTQAAPLAKTDRESELDKGDELFLRNRNRTAKDWKKASPPIIFCILRKTDFCILEQAVQSSDGEEVSDASHGTPKKRRKTRQEDDSDLPRWTRQAEISFLASDDESDVEITGASSSEVVDLTSSAVRGNNRPRSRSRSLTPPPELSMQQIQNVRNVVRTALGNLPRPDSPSNEHVDDSMDSIVLDEDLASIAREVRAQVNDVGDLQRGGGPGIVTIKVHWQSHPQNLDGHHDAFHALFEQIATTAGVHTGSLVLTHNGSRVFAADTSALHRVRLAEWSSPPAPGSAEGDGSESDAQSNGDDGDVFKLVIRSGVTKDVTLKVRPTTSCGAIVQAFLKRAGIADKYPAGKKFRKRGPRLMVDGEYMDPETPISEAELEDGDQVEVGGLQQ
ncbi:hypothetical protein F5148DRAFT_1273703 [Russula earlei]|uniref:Uncharacterized protein n=1 Tax=Russula earlei TaxID=71964 RepID=A0ACC0UKX7_9AGAM|nr:hypothetical protein F5148DRAFT_1273703 [Russula earlei]